MTGSLKGSRVVNTRATHQAADLDALLIEHGAVPIPYPCIAIEIPMDSSDLDSALGALIEGRFDWLVLTSANAVAAIETRLVALGLPAVLQPSTKIAAVGPATAAAAERLFAEAPDVVPGTHTGADLYREIPVERGQSVLLPRSEIGRDEIEVLLRSRGARVRPVVAYANVTGRGGSDVPGLLSAGRIDAITFCSSSAVDGLVKRLDAEGGSLAEAARLPVACLGPYTRKTAIDHGFSRATEAPTQTLAGLIEALTRQMVPQPQGGTRWA